MFCFDGHADQLAAKSGPGDDAVVEKRMSPQKHPTDMAQSGTGPEGQGRTRRHGFKGASGCPCETRARLGGSPGGEQRPSRKRFAPLEPCPTGDVDAGDHALRVSELCSLRWDAIDLESGLMHVRRLKNGTPSVHPLRGVEIRALRRLERETPVSPYVFTTERRGPMTPAGFRKTLAAIAEAASFPFPIHPHMLRHSAGYKLVNDREDTRSVQHYMGHKNIQHTVRYTELATGRFDSFWED